jgi:hypothetical protein
MPASSRLSTEADLSALATVLPALEEARTPEEAIRLTLSTVREAFGWEYGSF